MKLRDTTTTSMMEVREEHGNTAQSNSNGQEERIYVAIRVRPLNERERARHDVSEWECISDNTIRFKNNGHAELRSLATDTHTFGKKHAPLLTLYTLYQYQYDVT